MVLESPVKPSWLNLTEDSTNTETGSKQKPVQANVKYNRKLTNELEIQDFLELVNAD